MSAKDDSVRTSPYIWPTWLTKLLAGEEKCWYKSWFKSTRNYVKREDPSRADFFTEWTKKHDAITNKRADRMRSDGWAVKVEEEGEFNLKGKGATLAGKPDIVGIRDGRGLVIDAKAGKQRESDHWQVLIYKFALPLSWFPKKMRLEGEVQYRDMAVGVRPLGDDEVEAITNAIKRVSDLENPPPTVPTVFECGRCDVEACKARVERPAPTDATRFF